MLLTATLAAGDGTASTPPSAVSAEAIGPQPYTLKIVSASVAPRRPDGKAWDPGDGRPDVVVEVRVVGAGQGSVRTTKADNTTSPTWNESGMVTINKGDRLVALVLDKDALNDDTIDTLEVMFVDPGTLTLQGTSVSALVLEITPIKD